MMHIMPCYGTADEFTTERWHDFDTTCRCDPKIETEHPSGEIMVIHNSHYQQDNEKVEGRLWTLLRGQGTLEEVVTV